MCDKIGMYFVYFLFNLTYILYSDGFTLDAEGHETRAANFLEAVYFIGRQKSGFSRNNVKTLSNQYDLALNLYFIKK